MADGQIIEIKTQAELDALLARAAADGRPRLGLFGREAEDWQLEEFCAGAAIPAYRITFPASDWSGLGRLQSLIDLTATQLDLDDAAARLVANLPALTRLDLGANQIGDEGARALASLAALTTLDLGANQIGDEGARALASLAALTTLDLGANQIGDDGARALASLAALTTLDLGANQIGDDGARALASLAALTTLDLGANQIGDEGARALASLTALTSLTNLNLGGNRIGDNGAWALTTLTALTKLDLSDNQIGDDGARALATLPALTVLHLGYNQIGDDGARAFATLPALTVLSLWHNQIGDDGVRALATLPALAYLTLESNQISTDGARAFLRAIDGGPLAQTLRVLALHDNGDLSAVLPPEALETYNAQAILAAWRSFNAARVAGTRLNEAKLLVLGNEAVGKTSLIRYLASGNPRDPVERKTPGIATHRGVPTGDWGGDGEAIALNIWDFGGQEIMHGTHRFFLTSRSLYLVVLEDRREDDQSLRPWLATIGALAGDVPILVVINKSDQGKAALRIDESTLEQDYPGIAVLRTSCNDDDWARGSIQGLRARIARMLAEDPRLGHVRDPFPDTWRRVRDEVVAEADKVLTTARFERICDEAGVTEPAAQRALLGLLHHLGVVVAYGLTADAPAAQREISLLKPEWLTEAIYTVLNRPDLRDRQAQFTAADLTRWLNAADYPRERHEFILGMMQDRSLDLCLALPDTAPQTYLVPEALSPNAIDFQGFQTNALQLEVHYAHLPRAVLPRLIARCHRLLTREPTLWREGAKLQAHGCDLVVRGYPGDKGRVVIWVQGPVGQRRRALNTLLDRLDEVEGFYAELRRDVRVPLPDQPDKTVGYDWLIDLEQRKGADHRFEPEGAARDYRVGELLEGVRRDPAPRDQGEWEGRGRITITANNGSQVILGKGNDANVTTTTQTAAPAPAAPPPALPWPWVSVALGAAVAVMVALAWGLPGWRLWIGTVGGAFATVTLVVLLLDPAAFYRRLLAGWVLLGAGVIGLGGVEFATTQIPWLDRLAWSTAVAPWQGLVWLAVAALLIWRDHASQPRPA